MAIAQEYNKSDYGTGSGNFDAFKSHLRVGGEAPNFTIKRLDGGSMKLSDFRGKKHVVLEFGSIT
ncbi:MAG: hypothetical protein V3R13_02270 [Nitrososphaerales archaeon]